MSSLMAIGQRAGRQIPETAAPPDPPRQSRRTRELERHRAEILKAARDLFAEHGFERTAMTDVARRSEFAVGTLYKFFETKEQLYREIIEHVASDTLRGIQDAAERSAAGASRRLDEAIESLVSSLVRHGNLARCCLEDTLYRHVDSPQSGTRSAPESSRAIHTALTELIETGIREGVLIPVDASALAAALLGTIMAVCADLARRPDCSSAEHTAGLCKRILFDAVRLKPRIRLTPAAG
jgi:AcrR family transcriptional regulator